jgi:glycosyltransferase involved in cell wall biosynthesis
MDGYCVVIPAYNAAQTIGEAIESIFRQSLLPKRIVVVDDGSTDETGEIVRGYGDRLSVIRQDNAGVSAATNRGIAEVDTELLTCLDADDIWLPGKVELQLSRLDQDRSLDGTFGSLRLFRHGHEVEEGAPVRANWGRTTMMVRTAAARRVGPLTDPAPGGRGDMIDWISRGRDLGLRFEMLPDVLGLRRIMPGSMSFGHDQRDLGYLMAVKAALERKRSAKE